MTRAISRAVMQAIGVGFAVLSAAVGGCGGGGAVGNPSGSAGASGTGAGAGASGGAAGTGGRSEVAGSVGASGSSGAAGSAGVAGSTGAAGVAGAGAGTAGSGGVAGTGVAGSAASTGASGAVGRGGAGGTGPAGTSGVGGTEASAGSGGRAGASGAGGGAGALASTSLAVRFANAVLSRWPDPANISTTSGWEYNHGIVLRGIEEVYRHTGDARYLAYIQKYADEFVSAAGVVNIPAMHSFDNIQPSVLLPFLYQETGQAKYRTAADQIRARYDSIPRNPDQGFWHKQSYPNQMWLDSIYMGEPFLMRYGTVFGTCGTFCSDTVLEQVLLIAAHVRDATTGLLYHAWDDSAAGSKAAWANPTTGRSPAVWGRALGWYAMSLVDMLPDLPATATGRDQMLSILQSLAAALKTAQDPTTGLWFQVVDEGSRSDDWIESSGSGMFVYALKSGVDRGLLDSSYVAVAMRGWQGLQTKVTTDASGIPSITGAVGGLGVQSNYAGYVATTLMPLLTNSSHGLCAILLAASAMEAK